MKKQLPFTKSQAEEIASQYPTPWHVYDEAGIREQAHRLQSAFRLNKDFKNFFAVKATPNPAILKLLKSEGMGVDCSSLVELLLVEKLGFKGEDIMFSSNDTSAEEFVKARELGALINLDDITHIDFLNEAAGLPEFLSFRFNPGPARTGNSIIGKPEEAKFGLTRAQMIEAYRQAKQLGAQRFGLHTMVVSNELDPSYLVETVHMLFDLADEIKAETGVEIELINLGGGIGIPYLDEQEPFDMAAFSSGVEAVIGAWQERHPDQKVPRLAMECGRYLTGPNGYLVSRVLHLKDTYKQYVGLDAGMQNLMRPGMYGAYHHVTVLGKEDAPLTHMYDLTGSLCENNDKFAIDRALPEIEVGDLLVIHDTGAHGHSMGFNYNGKLRSAELLLADDKVELIRRAETADDYFATLEF